MSLLQIKSMHFFYPTNNLKHNRISAESFHIFASARAKYTHDLSVDCKWDHRLDQQTCGIFTILFIFQWHFQLNSDWTVVKTRLRHFDGWTLQSNRKDDKQHRTWPSRPKNTLHSNAKLNDSKQQMHHQSITSGHLCRVCCFVLCGIMALISCKPDTLTKKFEPFAPVI